MIPKKYYGLVLSAVLSVMMGLLMSGIVTVLNTGFDTGFISRWLSSFVIAVPIAFGCMQLLGPIARKVAAVLTKPESKVIDLFTLQLKNIEPGRYLKAYL